MARTYMPEPMDRFSPATPVLYDVALSADGQPMLLAPSIDSRMMSA